MAKNEMKSKKSQDYIFCSVSKYSPALIRTHERGEMCVPGQLEEGRVNKLRELFVV